MIFISFEAVEKRQIQDLQVKIWLDWQLPVELQWEVQWYWLDDRRGDQQAAAWCGYEFRKWRNAWNILNKKDKYSTWQSKSTYRCLCRKRIMSFLCVGIDKLLAQHIAHLFIRDPLSIFEEKIHLDDENESDHFEVRLAVSLLRKSSMCKNRLEFTQTCVLAEPAVNQLADDEVQTSTSELWYRLESWVPPHGGRNQLHYELI